jgi:hypothetical protein
MGGDIIEFDSDNMDGISDNGDDGLLVWHFPTCYVPVTYFLDEYIPVQYFLWGVVFVPWHSAMESVFITSLIFRLQTFVPCLFPSQTHQNFTNPWTR